MRRRGFIALVGGAALALPLKARAQRPTMPVIGYLNSRPKDDASAPLVTAFHRGLSEIGYVEGTNVAVEYRWGNDQYDRLPALLADLVHRNVSVIVTSGPAALPAKTATTKIPIVFITGDDPVKIGLVAALNRPGGNLTGITMLGGELGSKRLELLHELLPAAKSFALLVNPKRLSLAETTARDVQAAARIRSLQVQVVHASTERELETVFATLPQLQADALIIGADAFFNGRSQQLAAFSLRQKLPAIYQYHAFAAAGGLISYGGSLTDSFRLAGVYTGRILKGEKAAELPVQQSTKVELVINLKTAKELGLTIPPTLLARADEVIE